MITISDVRLYWDQRPCNIRHSDHAVGTREYFDQVEQRKFFAEPHIRDFSDFAAWNGKSVLEIGCGIGTAAVNFARSGARYTGIELSEVSLELARKRFEVYGLSGKFYHGNAEELQSFLPIDRYDLVYSWGVLHHTPDPDRVIQHIKSYLAKDGMLKIMVYARNSWKNFMITAGLDQPEAQSGCPLARVYDATEIESLLGRDFEINQIKQDHIFPYEIESYKRKQYQLQPWFQSMPADMFRVLEHNLGWHLMITATRTCT